MQGRVAKRFVLLFAGLTIAGCVQDKVELATAKVETRRIVGYDLLKGTLVTPPGARRELLSPFRAGVDKVFKSVGDHVTRGEPIVQLQVPNADAAVSEAESYVRSAQTSESAARTTLGVAVKQAEERLNSAREAERAAREGGDPSLQTYTDARMAAEQALANAKAELQASMLPYRESVADARQYLSDAKAGLRQGQIRSPISGTVVELKAQPGYMLKDPAEPVAVVVNLAALQVQAPLTAQQAGRVKPGQRLTLAFKELAGKEFEGRVSKITTLPTDSGEATQVAVIEFANDDALVKPGMAVAFVGIKTGEKDGALAVPNSAIETSGDGKAIVKVLEQGKWRARVVEVGLTGIEYSEVKSGLKLGDVVQVKVSK